MKAETVIKRQKRAQMAQIQIGKIGMIRGNLLELLPKLCLLWNGSPEVFSEMKNTFPRTGCVTWSQQEWYHSTLQTRSSLIIYLLKLYLHNRTGYQTYIYLYNISQQQHPKLWAELSPTYKHLCRHIGVWNSPSKFPRTFRTLFCIVLMFRRFS